uniref:Nuclear transcription factor Y subunit n=1 Tax=Araucaria cunninghamii TaxID=56994 RepID=A0A0D6QYF4_ARACU
MMTMQADYGGQGARVAGQAVPPAAGWWGGIGAHAVQNGAVPAKGESAGAGTVLDAAKQVGLALPQSLSSVQGSCHTSHPTGPQLGNKRVQTMTTHSGYDQSNGNGPQNQLLTAASAPAEYLLPHTQVELGHSIARASYPYTDPYFGGFLAAYGAQAVIHSHMLGVQQARMPLPLETEEEPVYVNAKQYHGILRRRQLRAKAELENKVVKSRKPYLHESRHLHAMRRARGCGGRFLNTKKPEESKVNADNGYGSQGPVAQTGSSSGSEAFPSENGNINISQDVQGGTLGMSSSEVTSMPQSYADGKNYIYSHKDGLYLSHHKDQHFHLSAFHALPSGSHEGEVGDGGTLISNGSQQKAVAIL